MSSNNQQLTTTLFFPQNDLVTWTKKNARRRPCQNANESCVAWAPHPFGCIIQRFRKLLLCISCSIYLTLSISFSFLFFFFFTFFFLRCFTRSSIPRNTLFFYMLYSYSFPGPSLLCWGFARISRCITVVIACRDCLQLSERTSVSVQHWLSLSLSFSWLYFVEFFFFFFWLIPPPPFSSTFCCFAAAGRMEEEEDWWRN